MPLLVVFERKTGLEPAGAYAPARGDIYIPPKSPFEKGGLQGSRVESAFTLIVRGVTVIGYPSDYERKTGLEPATLGLGSQCSTN